MRPFHGIDYVIRTYLLTCVADETIDFNAIGGIKDIAFKVTGDFTVLITYSGTNSAVQLPANEMLSLGGYDNAVRDDVIQIQFIGAGTKKELEIYGNKIIRNYDGRQ